MHRVELKVVQGSQYQQLGSYKVPNAPCGVERNQIPVSIVPIVPVPNAPCGVERCQGRGFVGVRKNVPNAPCGVESVVCQWKLLMQRSS